MKQQPPVLYLKRLSSHVRQVLRRRGQDATPDHSKETSEIGTPITCPKALSPTFL